MMYVMAYLYVLVRLCPLSAWVVPFIVCRPQTYEELTCSGTSLSGVHMLGWKPPPPCPLPLPVSELVLLPHPCLPRMEVFGGRVFTERGLGEAMGVVVC